MIQGHIDRAGRSLVEGWIHSPLQSLKGETVLAFVGDQCVGAGEIGLFRQDLVDADLGDGFGGFSFSVALQPWQDHRILDVRLDGSNFLIRQDGTQLSVKRDPADQSLRPVPDPLALSWMLRQGWISQGHHDTLRQLGRFGLRTLPLEVDPAGLSEARQVQALAAVVGPLLESLFLLGVRLEVRSISAQHQLARLRAVWTDAVSWAPPVIGLWCERTTHLRAVEGSHLARADQETGLDPLAGAVEVEFGGAQLLLLNLECQFVLPADSVACLALVPQLARVAVA